VWFDVPAGAGLGIWSLAALRRLIALGLEPRTYGL